MTAALWNLAGWTMLHYLWIGLAIGAVTLMVRTLLRRTSPHVRYTAMLVMFALLTVAPLVIAVLLAANINNNDSRGATLRGAPQADIRDSIPQEVPPLVSQPNAAERSSPATMRNQTPTPQLALPQWTLTTIAHALPYVWLLGAPLTFALLATGVLGVERLKRSAQVLATGPLRDSCDRLTHTLRVTQQVAVAISDAVAQPVLVGIVRPLILLPAAVVSECSPQQLELMLAHELAHVRRRDNLVNFIQRLVESLLFFQPAVWLVSHWLRRDREECCDALVVVATGRPNEYAQLLLSLATAAPTLTAAMARHPVSNRIRKILNLPEETMLVPRRLLLGLVTGCAAVLLAVATYLPSVRAEEAKPATAKDAKVAKEEAAKPKFAREEYRYEGKTFAEWDQAWRTELSEARRIEAVKALREFAQVGYEREAVEVILDVAEECDFERIGKEYVKKAILNQLRGESFDVDGVSTDGLPANIWLPILDQRARKSPKKYEQLLPLIVGSYGDEQAVPIIKELAYDPTSPLSGRAQWDLLGQEMRRCRRSKEAWPSPVVLEVMELKADDTSARWQWILEMTDPSTGLGNVDPSRLAGQGYCFSEFTSLLLSTDKDLRSKARVYLVRLNDAEKKKVFNELLKQLDGEQSDERMLAILKLLPWSAPPISEPTPRLQELAASENENIAIATLSSLHGMSAARKPESSSVFEEKDIVWTDDWFIDFALKRHPIELDADRWGRLNVIVSSQRFRIVSKDELDADRYARATDNRELVKHMLQVVIAPAFGDIVEGQPGVKAPPYPELTPEELAFLKHYQRLCKIRSAIYTQN